MTRNNSGVCKGKVTVSCGPGESFSITTPKAVSVFSQVLSSLGSETWFNIIYSKLQRSHPLPQGGPNQSLSSQHEISLLRLQKSAQLWSRNTWHSDWSNQEKHFGYWTRNFLNINVPVPHLFTEVLCEILTLRNNYFIFLLWSITHT